MNILIYFGVGFFFGVMLTSVLFYKAPALYKGVCALLNSFYNRQKKGKQIKIENWR